MGSKGKIDWRKYPAGLKYEMETSLRLIFMDIHSKFGIPAREIMEMAIEILREMVK